MSSRRWDSLTAGISSTLNFDPEDMACGAKRCYAGTVQTCSIKLKSGKGWEFQGYVTQFARETAETCCRQRRPSRLPVNPPTRR